LAPSRWQARIRGSGRERAWWLADSSSAASSTASSDILAGFDRAVADDVDVISVSIGGGGGVTAPFYLDPIAINA
jgi:hypothetical protein